MSTLYLTNLSSNFSSSPSTDRLSLTLPEDGSESVDVPGNGAAVLGWLSDQFVPCNDLWEAGSLTFYVSIDSTTDYFTAYVKAGRMQSDGTIAEYTSEVNQSFTTTGQYTFTIPSITWSSGSKTDRLYVQLRVTNSSAYSRSFTWTWGNGAVLAYNFLSSNITINPRRIHII